MPALVTSVALGLLGGLLWLLLWGAVLRTPLIIWFARTPKKRALQQQRFIYMGQVRYILLVGILGSGLAAGLTATIFEVMIGGAASWELTITKLILLSLFWGLFQGSTSWDMYFRNASHPPHPSNPPM